MFSNPPPADKTYRTYVSTVVVPGDYVQVTEPDGTIGVRYLAPGLFQKGEAIPYLYKTDGVTPADTSDGDGQLRL